MSNTFGSKGYLTQKVYIDFGFRLGDSCINQLLSINHEILNAFDKRLEVIGLFLGISKAFSNV